MQGFGVSDLGFYPGTAAHHLWGLSGGDQTPALWAATQME